MKKIIKSQEFVQSFKEEIANSVSHGVGFLAAIVGSTVLIFSAVQNSTSTGIVGASVFAFTMLLLYLTSTLYHAFTKNETKSIFRILDHCAIYLLIAGTYTPFTLGVLSGTWGWIMFGCVWGIAVAGIILKIVGGVKFEKLSIILYLAMGWLIIIVIKPLWISIPHWGFFWILAGGAAYMAGLGFYAARRLPYAHFIWHLFVIAGTACHYIAILKYSI